MKELIFLIPLLPLLGFIIIGATLNKVSKKFVSFVGCGSVALSMIISFGAIIDWLITYGSNKPFVYKLFEWVPLKNIALTSFSVPFAFQLDALSALMISFVTFVGFLIHVYSTGYMAHEDGYARYFAYLNLFMFSMLTLVLADNFLLTFVGWEGVGLCSYLLIGYYYKEDYAANAGKKAFIVNRIGDFGFLMGIFLIYQIFGSLRYEDVFNTILANPTNYSSVLTIIGICLFVGAIGKSAQLPLYVWLPDAMAGPTPVSALIHAATMVTAGVFMITRSNIIYQLSPTAMAVVAIVGGLTAFFAATMGIAQKDVKKVLAYSTISQLGYMFLAAGVGAYAIAIFHVFTHAFFKACLFLGSGSLIHACHSNDIFDMGGLRKKMPTTHWTFLFATLAIAGIPLFAGFFSKDAILSSVFVFSSHHSWGYIFYILSILTAAITSFYMFRLYYVIFAGDYRGHEHPHESPFSMTIVLQILAIGSLVVGFVGLPIPHLNVIGNFLGNIIPNATGAEPHHPAVTEEIILMVLSVAIALAGWLLARTLYYKDKTWGKVRSFITALPNLYRVVFNKYYVDEMYKKSFINGTLFLSKSSAKFDQAVVDGIVNGVGSGSRSASFLSGIFDLKVVDGIVNLLARFLNISGGIIRKMQTGVVHNYLFIFTLAIFLSLGLYLLIK